MIHKMSDCFLYIHIAANLRNLILKGDYLPGQKLSSIRLMAKEEGCNPATVYRAFKLLEQEGFVYTQNRKGYFVTNNLLKLETSRKKELRKLTKEFIEKLNLLGYSNKEIGELLERYSNSSL